MPTFDTPGPISVTIDLVLGDATISASDRTDTVVEVNPSNGSSAADERAAAQTRVEYSNGTLLIKGPRQRGFFDKGGSIDVTIDLPAGSHVRGDAASAGFRGEGRLGDCRFRTASGDLRLEHTGALQLNTARGDITVDRSVGRVDVTAGSGDVRIREIDGTAAINTASGETTVGVVTGDLRLKTASGDISVDRAQGAVDARSASGSIRIGEVIRGSVVLETASGALEIGVREGTAAWLDVSAHSGTVRSSLDAADSPQPSDETVEVRARTYSGDIVIRRS